MNRTLGIGWQDCRRCSAQAALFRRCERDPFGLSSQIENSNALEAFRIDRLVFLANQEDFNRRVFRDEFNMVRAGIDETPAMQIFRLMCVGGEGGQQGNTEGEISELHAQFPWQGGARQYVCEAP